MNLSVKFAARNWLKLLTESIPLSINQELTNFVKISFIGISKVYATKNIMYLHYPPKRRVSAKSHQLFFGSNLCQQGIGHFI